MSNPRVSTAAFLIAAALCFTQFAARADAPPQAAPGATTPAYKATVALLVSAPWKFSGAPTWNGFHAIRIFDADGTFNTVNALSERGKWSISNNILVLGFEDGHTDRVPLPLNPDGCKGTDADGLVMNAVRSSPSSSGGANVPSSNIVTHPAGSAPSPSSVQVP